MLKEPDLADHGKVLECLIHLLTSHERLAAMSAAALTQVSSPGRGRHRQPAGVAGDRIDSPIRRCKLQQ